MNIAPMQVCRNVEDPVFLQELKQLEPDLFMGGRYFGMWCSCIR